MGTSGNDLFLVAIGASAGGLEPLQQFFTALKPPKNTAFVVIQHLSPDYKSMMGELLQRNTDLPIFTVEDGTKIKSGNVYLIPPKFNIFLRDTNTFGATPKPSGVINLPIDVFISSAAGFFNDHMAAIVLSGTGSDGARGVVGVNAAGGLAMAQSPESAQFDGMPNSAIATGFIDDVGDPEYLAKRISAHIDQRNGQKLLDESDTNEFGSEVKLTDVLHELKLRTGIPFDEYKKSTVARRIERRMALRHVSSLSSYLNLLRTTPDELDTLRRETLIGVTSFFRDPEAFEQLKLAIGEILKDKVSGDTLRIWVAGCSTGEEAYSIAMTADECIRNAKKIIELKIFATDLEPTYVDVAASGTYPESISSEISPERLKQYFSRVGDRLRVRPELRKSIIFAKHNMIIDAPFTKVDLVSCRNTLIYFETELQERVLKRFQYALGPNGVLFLGSSESLGRLQRDFTVIHASAKLWRTLRPAALSLEALQVDTKIPTNMPRARTRKDAVLGDPIERARQVLIEHLAPPSLLLSQSREVVHIFGDVTPFLKLPKGEATLDASRMLDTSAATALLKLLKERDSESSALARFESGPLRIRDVDDRYYRMRLEALGSRSEHQGMLLLAFIDVNFASSDEVNSRATTESDNQRINVLEGELTLTRQNLQNTIEELEASNEELQATNEELLASNEELQSTNEELQSVNEELYTVNSEYQEKIRILDQVNEDLDTMATATGIPTLFLDENINIVRFTPSVTTIYQLRDSDIGRGLEEFSNKIGLEDLVELARNALATQEPHELHWSSPDVKTMLIRIVPYSETAYGARALVIMFINVTEDQSIDKINKA
ncbi:CheB methylesterase/CheR methyltransferase [gamma proteobacterium NOR5-3]|nr:CheB methylesterase/CheR methyltransferase [gamma proteobacterium NOR5-3]